MQNINRIIVAIEGLVLGYPALVGVFLSLGAIVPPIIGSRQPGDVPNAIAGVLVLVGLTLAAW